MVCYCHRYWRDDRGGIFAFLGIKNEIVGNAAIYIAGTDQYAHVLRRNLMTYNVLRTSTSTLITVYASFDGGTLVNGSGSPNDVMNILRVKWTIPLLGNESWYNCTDNKNTNEK